MKKLAIITGANGGIGQVITRALAVSGYKIIMACRNPESVQPLCEQIKMETGNKDIEILKLNLCSLSSVSSFARQLINRQQTIACLINNAGVLSTGFYQTEDGLESTVSTNYVGPYLLTRLLLPAMQPGSRIINTLSCTYKIGKIENDFFRKGRNGSFHRMLVYGNTKRALLLFTLEMARRTEKQGITVNAADPGIVNTNMISMKKWFDPLTNIFFRPFIRTPEQGAATTIHLALSDKISDTTGQYFSGLTPKKLASNITNPEISARLWLKTEEIVTKYL